MLETPGRFEPAFLEGDLPQSLADLALEVDRSAKALPGKLPAAAAAELADLVRITNCYYSNLIEGHKTRPADIEAALSASGFGERRPLLLEARAHVEVQRHIDTLAAAGKLPIPTDAGFVADVHRRFYEAMPEVFRTVKLDGREIVVTPGAFRSKEGEDVAVGRHVPPSFGRVGDFMAAFAARFRQADGPSSRIIAIPAAHHRLNYIHPFVDGNGRVSRLVSHAMGHRAGIGGGGLWSISRGLARGLGGSADYKTMMELADSPRAGSLDGRGNLSEKALVEFSKWFLEVASDQIGFCAGLFEFDSLGRRYKSMLDARFEGDERYGRMVVEILDRGEVERGRVTALSDGKERTARMILSRCIEHGFLKSDSPKGKVRVGFPAEARSWLFPGLFADEADPGRPGPPRPRSAVRARNASGGWER